MRFLALLLLLSAAPAWAQEAPKCRLAQIAEWKVKLGTNQPIIDGAINGKPIGVMLDTGAAQTILMKAAADRLDLPTRPTQDFMVGFGGHSRVFVTTLEEVRIGEAVRKNWRIKVAGEGAFRGTDLILGDDFFKVLDMEFDYAKGVIRLFQPENCQKAFLGYWDPNAQVVPMEDGDKIHFNIRVNGREARTMLDSGASSSIVALSFAESVGLSTDSPAVLPGGCSAGLGGGGLRNWVGTFDTVAIGGQTIRDTRIRIQDYTTDFANARGHPPDVFLGTDFLRAHRVYVARSQNKIYFTHAGGQVFTATPSLGCDPQQAGLDAKKALAVLDEKIAANPGDANALAQRGSFKRREGDLNGGLADLDAAIKLAPGNGPAFAIRSGIRAQLKDYDGAMSDADAAVANGIRTASFFTTRGAIRRAQGNCAQALAEYEEALKIDPRSAAAQRGLDACKAAAAK